MGPMILPPGRAEVVDWQVVDPSTLVVGLDIGSSRTKSLLLDRLGNEVVTTVAPTPFARSGEHIEMTQDDLLSCVRGVLEGLGPARFQVAAVAVTGMAESGAPLDDSGSALAPIIAWHDPRGAEAVTALERRFGHELSRNLGQRIRTVSSVAKLGWLIGNGVERIHSWLGVPELCQFALCGSRATDYSLAARTGAYHVAEKRWLDEVTGALGFDVDVFPAVRPAGVAMGRVSQAASVWSGLPAGIPVTIAGHDHLAALAGSGAQAGDFGNSVGTAESVVARTPTVPDLERALDRGVAVTLAPSGSGWAVMAGAARSGTVLSAVADAVGTPPAELDERSDGAGSRPDGSAVADPELLNAVLAGDLSGLDRRHPERTWAALLAALSERTWDAVGRAGDLVGTPQRVVVFGGGAASRRWLSIKAANPTAELWRSTTPEAAARGAALTAGVAAGWWATPEDGPAPRLERVESD